MSRLEVPVIGNMESVGTKLFTPEFVAALKDLIGLHHSIYPRIPPQGIFFESLVERAFPKCGWPKDQVILTTPNRPQHDITVGPHRVSLKTETGKRTRLSKINITKLCTTEKDPWDSDTLIRHTLAHLDRYDCLLMFRAIWREKQFRYQLLEVPLEALRLIRDVTASAVGGQGRRRQSLAVYVTDEAGENLFRIHFDGTDGKCQIKNLLIRLYRVIEEWDHPIED